jgi:phospholipase C
MYVISPWSRGGWANSQVFDHTSIGMFLEKRFGVKVASISPWHRAVSGDLTSAFDFTTPNDTALPVLPNMTNYAAVIAAQAALPLPTPPSVPQPLFQETGYRPSRALPYALNAKAVLSGTSVSLTFANTGAQGAVFHVYDQLHLDRIPRRYTVEAGKSLTDVWSTAPDGDVYNLWVYGPNGFVRTFAGNTSMWSAATFKPETLIGYSPATSQLLLHIHNGGAHANTVALTGNTQFLATLGQTISIPAGNTVQVALSLRASGNWYDFTATSASFQRRFAGRMETGLNSISDPSMAMHLT